MRKWWFVLPIIPFRALEICYSKLFYNSLHCWVVSTTTFRLTIINSVCIPGWKLYVSKTLWIIQMLQNFKTEIRKRHGKRINGVRIAIFDKKIRVLALGPRIFILEWFLQILLVNSEWKHLFGFRPLMHFSALVQNYLIDSFSCTNWLSQCHNILDFLQFQQ